MKLLHTSDWHIGRTFHGSSTLDAARSMLRAIADVARDHDVDVVLVPGDVWDSTTPSAEAYRVLQEGFRLIRETGAELIVTSGNHDSAVRLGYQSEWAAVAGVHVITDPAHLSEPVVLHDEHGPVAFFGVPYLEPLMIRHLEGADEVRTQHQALAWALARIRAVGTPRGTRSVVLAHCFAAGLSDEIRESDFERDITAGGLDVVPVSCFDGIDYVALGHIHTRATLAPGVRYSGSPLHYSFTEAGLERGAWLIELDAEGLHEVTWASLPVPRPLAVLRGTLDELLKEASFADHERAWVKAVLTDVQRPIDAMRTLQQRFPHCAVLEYAPEGAPDSSSRTSPKLVRQLRDPLQVTLRYLTDVRGTAPSPEDVALLTRAVEELTAERSAR